MEGLTHYAGWAIAVLMGLIAWFSRRDVSRYDQGLERIALLEKTFVSHDELERVITKFTSERERMHHENKEDLGKIARTLEVHEGRRSRTEHGIRDDVQLLTVQLAVLAQSQGIKLPIPRGRREDILGSNED